MAYKSERTWKDLERADKVVLFTGFFAFLIIMGSMINNNAKSHNAIKQQAVKTEMVRSR